MILDNLKPTDQTTAINKIPFKPGLLGALGLMRDEFVGSDAVTFDVRENSFFILEDHMRNAAQKNTTDDRPYDVHTLPIVHFPVERTIGREKLAGVRGFNQTTEQTVAAAVADELTMQSEIHDLHEEYMMSQMVVNGVLSTTYFGDIDMASEFNVTRPTETLAYTNPGDTLSGLRSAQSKAKAGLNNGGRIGGYVLLASEGLFNWLITNADVTRAYELGLSGPNPLFNQVGEVANGYTAFNLGVTTVVLYDDQFSKADGSTVQTLATDKGVLLPRTALGRTFWGRESTLDGLGRGGAKRFARSYMDPKNRFVEVMSEQNALPIVEQFGATVKIDFTP